MAFLSSEGNPTKQGPGVGTGATSFHGFPSNACKMKTPSPAIIPTHCQHSQTEGGITCQNQLKLLPFLPDSGTCTLEAARHQGQEADAELRKQITLPLLLLEEAFSGAETLPCARVQRNLPLPVHSTSSRKVEKQHKKAEERLQTPLSCQLK